MAYFFQCALHTVSCLFDQLLLSWSILLSPWTLSCEQIYFAPKYFLLIWSLSWCLLLLSLGRFCRQRILFFGDIYIPASFKSQVARSHHTSARKPRKQTDHTSVRLLWYVLFYLSSNFSFNKAQTRLACMTAIFLSLLFKMNVRQSMEMLMPGGTAQKCLTCWLWQL